MIKQKLLVVPMILALAGAGCSGSTSGTAPTAAPTGLAGSGAAPSRADGCTNPYYPFKVGSKISYKTTSGTGAASSNSTHTMEVQPASTSGMHKLVYTFTVRGESFPITQEFSCDANGIRATGMLDMSAAMGGMNISYETNSVDGPFMPADLAVGTNWDTTYNVTIHAAAGPLAAMMDGKRQSTRIKSTVVGEESVTVAAGTYRALKVKMDITITSEVFPNPIQTTTESWFVRDIGMVKSVTTGTGGGSTTEATALTGF